ncbi:unnamed protein product [Brassica napus]|uniref:(rape) hypothetical protein n=1 Tax=Brassica napus TaxID=3708 RepID=A0A816K7D2_BRANA|nr:unnamed protein product [Brassica napus]
MISQATFICILMISLFALHQCGQMDVGEIDKIDCWCCHRDSSLCYYNVDDCVYDNHCPL